VEVKTPIPDNSPCDPDRVLNVTVPAANFVAGQSIAYLPQRFGCSSATDASREKASPAVTWSVNQDQIIFCVVN
jgi:hypothetical protein